ncbi:MAG: hydrolase [Chlamydiales bacterium]|nr:hydrolase [Chlamydiales bacterium]
MKNDDKGYPCPCCGCLTRSEPSYGTFEICPVCNWEDDYVQFNDPNFKGGANEESLSEARKNFKKIGASSQKYINEVRAPTSDEMPT